MKKLILIPLLFINFYINSQIVVQGVSPSSVAGISYNFTWAAPGWYYSGSGNNYWGDSIPNFNMPGVFVQDTLELVVDTIGCLDANGNSYNQPSLAGKIAVVLRGTCQFSTKAALAENNGAVGIIIINNTGSNPITLYPGDSASYIKIPVVSISSSDGQTLLNEMANGTVEMLMGNPSNPITITHKVDVRDYLAFNPNGVGGVYISGNFQTYGALNLNNLNASGTNNNILLADYLIDDPTAEMEDFDGGDTIFKITITYPSTFVGDTINYRFSIEDFGSMYAENIYSNQPCSSPIESSHRYFILTNIDTTISNCWSSCDSYCTYVPVVGSSINENISLINIYPNPTNENITISVNNFNGNIKTEVYDLIGNRLQTTNETTISLRDYSKGIYILKVAYGDRVQEVKVIKD
jgi:hypothetical protein